MSLAVKDLRCFVPAKDFAVSKAFYVALGCAMEWNDDGLAVMAWAGSRFYLQNYYQKDWAENSMLHLTVADAHAWHAHVSALLAGGAFPGARVAPPKREDYGALVTHVWDPSGVLLHFAQRDGVAVG
jgi:hypothetical protein